MHVIYISIPGDSKVIREITKQRSRYASTWAADDVAVRLVAYKYMSGVEVTWL